MFIKMNVKIACYHDTWWSHMLPRGTAIFIHAMSAVTSECDIKLIFYSFNQIKFIKNLEKL